MTHSLRDRLEDLAEEPSALIRIDPHGALVLGVRRRHRRQFGTTFAVLVAAAGVAAGLTTVAPLSHPDPAAGAVSARQYPDRLDEALVDDEVLPRRPGPLAGLVDRVEHLDGYDEGIGWFAVSPRGQTWPVTDGYAGGAYPSLSADGTHLGFQQDPTTFVIRNLVTGRDIRYPQIAGVPPTVDYPIPNAIEFEFGGNMPSYWSPDSQRLVLIGNDYPDQNLVGVAVVLQPDGQIEPVRPDNHPDARVVGWVDNTHLAWLLRRKVEPASAATPGPRSDRASVRGSIGLLITDLQGHPTRDVPVAYPGSASQLFQFSVAVSPDGSTLAVLPSGGGLGPSRISLFDTATGRSRGRFDGAGDNIAANCGYTWQGNRPAFPTRREDDAALVAADNQVLITASEAFGATCSIWSSTALLGSSHHTPTTWVGLHHRLFTAYLVSGLATIAVLLATLIVVRRRRRRITSQVEVADGQGG